MRKWFNYNLNNSKQNYKDRFKYTNKLLVKNKSVEKAISIFKRKVKEAGILYELRERQEYKKPSAVKREKRAKALARKRSLKPKKKDKWL